VPPANAEQRAVPVPPSSFVEEHLMAFVWWITEHLNCTPTEAFGAALHHTVNHCDATSLAEVQSGVAPLDGSVPVIAEQEVSPSESVPAEHNPVGPGFPVPTLDIPPGITISGSWLPIPATAIADGSGLPAPRKYIDVCI
jgi:hypothetical protein